MGFTSWTLITARIQTSYKTPRRLILSHRDDQRNAADWIKLKECKGVIDALVNDEMSMEDRKEFIQSKIDETKNKIKSLRTIQSFLQEHLDNDCAYNSESMIAKLKG
jgi:predicted nuclease with TOPRIM domain